MGVDRKATQKVGPYNKIKIRVKALLRKKCITNGGWLHLLAMVLGQSLVPVSGLVLAGRELSWLATSWSEHQRSSAREDGASIGGIHSPDERFWSIVEHLWQFRSRSHSLGFLTAIPRSDHKLTQKLDFHSSSLKSSLSLIWSSLLIGLMLDLKASLF